MKFKSIYIKEGIFSRKEFFSNSVNLIYSHNNSKGKTSLLRFLLYSLGYNIPNIKNIKFNQCEVITTIITDDNDELIIKRNEHDYIDVIKNNIKNTYVLPSQLNEFHSIVFKTENKDILNNILGAFYVDQEKGWTLLNRGVAIGSIHFNIEELVRGLSERDCDSLINNSKAISRELKKYRQIASIAKYQETISNEKGSLALDSYEETNTVELEMLQIRKNALKKELNRIDRTINDNKKVKKYIADMKLMIKLSDDRIIHVNENNIIGLNDSIEYLVTKRNLIANELSCISNNIFNIENEFKNEKEQLTFLKSETLAEAFDRKISSIPINSFAINKRITYLEKQLTEIRKKINAYTKQNNNIITSLYENVIKYGTELGICNSETIAQSYLFTSNLKELSGAVLHKTVFSFRLAYIIEIQKKLGIKLPIILDSPTGKEIDENNIQLMVNILKRDFSDNQIIIASIFEYKFENVKKIEILDHLIEKIDDAN